MKSFRELIIWQKAHKLVLAIYSLTKDFPPDEKYGLVSQIRRSAVSVAANIVEGFKRRSNKEFKQFINIAAASLEETKYYLLLSRDLNYLSLDANNQMQALADELGKMLHSFYEKLSAES